MFYQTIKPGRTYNDNGGGRRFGVPIFARYAKHRYNLNAGRFETGWYLLWLSLSLERLTSGFGADQTGARLHGFALRLTWGWVMSRFSRVTDGPAGDQKRAKTAA